MKQHWHRMQIRIDALSLRERAIIFAMAALILLTLVNSLLLDPTYARQKQLSQAVKTGRAELATVQMNIQQAIGLHESDPDRAAKQLLEQYKAEIGKMEGSLADMQKGLVSPDKMPALLEDLLKQNKGLRLVSLKTLPAMSLAEQASAEDKRADSALAATKDGAGKAKKSASDTVYKHDVEIVLQGGYLDLMNYLAQLEAMPWHLFWSKAKLNVEEYPKTTLSLTVFTLSLDRKWLNL
jgi:MSHA biogenesis protein MshJ